MNDDNVITLLVLNTKHMKKLAQLFGSICLNPLTHPENGKQRHITISAYGISKSKKTTFFKATTEGVTPTVHDLFSWKRSRQETAEKEKRVYRYADLGEHTYFSGDQAWRHEGRPREEWLFTDCNVPLIKSIGAPGITLIEHPSIPHLFNSQIVAIFGSPLEVVSTSAYFYGVACGLDKWKDSEKTKAIKKQVLEQMNKVKKYSFCRNFYNVSKIERVLSLVLIASDPDMQTVFNNFRKHAPTLSPI